MPDFKFGNMYVHIKYLYKYTRTLKNGQYCAQKHEIILSSFQGKIVSLRLPNNANPS